MQKRGLASPDDGDALALTFAQAVAPAEKEERDEDEEFGRCGGSGSSGWMQASWNNPTSGTRSARRAQVNITAKREDRR
jgi:hypothetical protein